MAIVVDRAAVTAALGELAAQLELLRAMGVTPRCEHGVVSTDVGYVLPGPDEVWTTRLKADSHAGAGAFLLLAGPHDDLDD